jgi:hypothetical protein
MLVTNDSSTTQYSKNISRKVAKLAKKDQIICFFKDQDFKIFLASFACARALATAGYGFARDAF